MAKKPESEPVTRRVLPGETVEQYKAKFTGKQLIISKDETYDFLVFIGRFQPFHNGHQAIIDQALKLAKRVVVLVGSANLARSPRNPFTYQEREEMIASCYPATYDSGRLIIKPLADMTYLEADWIEQVQKIVKDATWNYTREGETKIGLIGRNKDNSSYYLKKFPAWGSVPADTNDWDDLNATDIRTLMFADDFAKLHAATLMHRLPLPVLLKLNLFMLDDEFKRLKEELRFIEKYRAQWAGTPYAVTFNTVDAVVIQSGHILLVRRGAAPGKGLWALPGGFLNENEVLLAGAIRELQEETKIDVPKAMLLNSVKANRSFDDVHRDPRGRFITQAFLIQLPEQTKLPKVKGSDDADKAKWVPLVDLKPENLYADHYFIIRAMTANL